MADIKRIVTSGGGGGGGGYDTIAKGGAPFPQESTINFVGASVIVTDNAGATSTNISFAAGLNDIAAISPTSGIIINGNGTNFVGNTITASRAVVTNASNVLTASAVTSTELGYLSGATSNIQTQINALSPPVISVITTDTAIVMNTTYIVNGAGLVTLTLPATFSAGQFVKVVGYAGGWKIAQNSGQNILLNGDGTTIGTGGFLASQQDTDGITLYSVTTDTNLVATDSQGPNITVN